jgi:hypothetical protein
MLISSFQNLCFLPSVSSSLHGSVNTKKKTTSAQQLLREGSNRLKASNKRLFSIGNFITMLSVTPTA